ncbi:hypothetical protein EC990672_3139A, partial [Escherichia coli 99.0672]
MAQVIAKL